MATYSNTNTIIVWSDDKEILKYTNEIAKALGIQICEPDHVVDVLAIPCFIKIIDAKYLKELIDYLENDKNGINEYFTYFEDKIILYGKTKNKIPQILEDIIEEAPAIISKKYLLKIIESTYELAKKAEILRKTQFRNRAFRAIYIYNIIETESYLNIDKIASRLDLDNKTIDRDINTLLAIFPKLDITYIDNENNAKSRKTVRKTSSAKKPLTFKEKQLHDKIKRIIYLRQILKKGEHISVQKNRDKFGISEKTLARDIKVLRDINPTQKISYSKEKGYYM